MTAARDPLPANNALGDDGDYVVPAPRATDVLSRSLHRAFGPSDDQRPFADLLAALDLVA